MTSSQDVSTTEGSSSSNSIRWGIVGLGDVTEKKSGPPFFKCTGSSLVAVMRRTPGKAADWVQRMGLEETCTPYDNLDAFLEHPDLDAVYISTRPDSHLELGQKVARAGKACYVEKPVGRCAAETAAIVNAFREASQPLYTAYMSRAYARTQKLRQILGDSSLLGDSLQSIEYTVVGQGGARGMDMPTAEDGSVILPWRLQADQAGGGLIMDIGCHLVDRLDYLLGPLEQVKGSASNFNSPHQQVEDYVELSAVIGASDQAAIPSQGATVKCVWDFTGRTDEDRDELVLTGSAGVVRCIGMSAAAPIQVYDLEGNLKQEFTFETPLHTAQCMVQAMTNELRGQASEADLAMLSRGDNAVRASKVLDTILESYYGGRDIGFWNQSDSWPGRPKQA